MTTPFTNKLQLLCVQQCSRRLIFGILFTAGCFNVVWCQTPRTGPISSTQSSSQFNPQGSAQTRVLTLDEVLRLAQATASTYEQAKFTERVAEEDVKQAHAAFFPRIASQPTFIYTSPSTTALTPRTFSFIGANAITEYQVTAGAEGELDLSGRLRATLRRNQALVQAAHAGTEVERRNLLLATVENYYGLAVSAARRNAAELNLAAATEFENITVLLEQAGEVAQVDLLRARLGTTARRDELERSRVAEDIAREGLRVLIGYDLGQPLVVPELSFEQPDLAEIDRFTAQMIAARPELAQLDAQRTALVEEAKQARAELWPQITYNIIGGFETDSFHTQALHEHSGVQATVGINIPIFDWGAKRSRERQAKYRLQSLESARQLALHNFNQQFVESRLQALSAAERIRLSRAGIADGERNLEVSIARYRAGEAQIIEVTDAQNTLTSQKAALYQAVFEYHVALSHLRQAAGQAER